MAASDRRETGWRSWPLTGFCLPAVSLPDRATAHHAACLRTTGMVKTPTIDIVLGLHATAHGITQREFWAAIAATHRQRASPLVELGEVAVWPATGPAQ